MVTNALLHIFCLEWLEPHFGSVHENEVEFATSETEYTMICKILLFSYFINYIMNQNADNRKKYSPTLFFHRYQCQFINLDKNTGFYKLI